MTLRRAARRRSPIAAGRGRRPSRDASVGDAGVSRRRLRLAAGAAGLGVRRAARPARRRRGVRAPGDRAAAPSPSCPKQPAPADVARAVDAGAATRGSRSRRWRPTLLRPSRARELHGRRHHRHQRQDDDGVPARVDLRGRRHPLRPLGTVGYRIGDARSRPTRTTPEAPELQRLLREMVDAGLRRLRDGSVVARAGAAARRRHALRRRRSSPT